MQANIVMAAARKKLPADFANVSLLLNVFLLFWNALNFAIANSIYQERSKIDSSFNGDLCLLFLLSVSYLSVCMVDFGLMGTLCFASFSKFPKPFWVRFHVC